MLIRRISQSGAASRAIFHFDQSVPDILSLRRALKRGSESFQNSEKSCHQKTNYLRDFIIFINIPMVLISLHFHDKSAYSRWKSFTSAGWEKTIHTSGLTTYKNPLVKSPEMGCQGLHRAARPLRTCDLRGPEVTPSFCKWPH